MPIRVLLLTPLLCLLFSEAAHSQLQPHYLHAMIPLQGGGYAVSYSGGQTYVAVGSSGGIENPTPVPSGSSLAPFGPGGFLVAWGSMGRCFDDAGDPVSDEFVVREDEEGGNASARFIADGRVAVVWNTEEGYYGRVYGPDCSPEGGAVALVVVDGALTLPSGERIEGFSSRRTSVTLSTGGAVRVWRESPQEVRAQRYDGNGEEVGGSFRVSDHDYFVEDVPAIAALPDGEYVVAWAHRTTGNALYLRARVFTADDTPRHTVGFDPGGLDVHALPLTDGRIALGYVRTLSGMRWGPSVHVFSPGGATSVGAEPSVPAVRLTSRPNPARTRATLTLSVGAPGDVSVEAYDVLGRRVAVLHEGWLGAGEHEVPFEASALPAGVYLVRAVGDGFAVTRRITVVP